MQALQAPGGWWSKSSWGRNTLHWSALNSELLLGSSPFPWHQTRCTWKEQEQEQQSLYRLRDMHIHAGRNAQIVLGQWHLPLPHLHHGKRTDGLREAKLDAINTARSWSSLPGSILFSSDPRHHPSFTLCEMNFSYLIASTPFLTPLRSVLEEKKKFRQGFLSLPKGNIPGRTEKSEELLNHPSGYWPWVMEASGECQPRWLPHSWDFLGCLIL